MDDYYFEWLCEKVNADDPDCSFRTLLGTMHSRIFRWYLDLDEDRAMDGIGLREIFIDELDVIGSIDDLICDADDVDDFLVRPCSVLEMLIALSMRIQEDIMWNPDKGDRTPVWFWLMIKNLGLNDLDDSHFYGEACNDRVIETLDIWMERQFKPNGEGSIFPVFESVTDFREVLIWYQMSEYFLVNYGIEEDFDGVL